MPARRKDGTPAKAANRLVLTERNIHQLKAEPGRASAFWDQRAPGLCLLVQATGHRAFKFVYRHRHRARWFHIGMVSLDDARTLALKLRLKVVEGGDPVADRQTQQASGTFAELTERYFDEHAKRKHKSWQHALYLARRNLLPRWGHLAASSITRGDVRAMMSKIAAPTTANLSLAAASSIFSWAVDEEIVPFNPCRGIKRNPTQSRERVLSDSELPLFWAVLIRIDAVNAAAIKTILLTGQRPGEVRHMRREHIADSWWTLPGKADSHWPGTKNSQTHCVWLPEAVLKMVQVSQSEHPTGFVFATNKGKPLRKLDAAMRQVSELAGFDEPVRPHDLRRTHGSTITKLGFGRDAMNRVQNHREGGIADVYDRHRYEEENKRVMEAVATHLMMLAEGRREESNVVRIGGR
jgi:integrase